MVEIIGKEKFMTCFSIKLVLLILALSSVAACGVRGDPVAPSMAKKQTTTQN